MLQLILERTGQGTSDDARDLPTLFSEVDVYSPPSELVTRENAKKVYHNYETLVSSKGKLQIELIAPENKFPYRNALYHAYLSSKRPVIRLATIAASLTVQIQQTLFASAERAVELAIDDFVMERDFIPQTSSWAHNTANIVFVSEECMLATVANVLSNKENDKDFAWGISVHLYNQRLDRQLARSAKKLSNVMTYESRTHFPRSVTLMQHAFDYVHHKALKSLPFDFARDLLLERICGYQMTGFGRPERDFALMHQIAMLDPKAKDAIPRQTREHQEKYGQSDLGFAERQLRSLGLLPTIDEAKSIFGKHYDSFDLATQYPSLTKAF